MVGFDPIVGTDAKILILGSMPGLKSLQETRYYAHPRNCFWWIMQQSFNFSSELDYQQSCQKLVEHKIAVWDVLYDCERPGSLDQNIIIGSEKVNNFKCFLKEYSEINKILFNGQKANKLFVQRVGKLSPSIEMVTLPSTSPAHASISRQEKLFMWQEQLFQNELES